MDCKFFFLISAFSVDGQFSCLLIISSEKNPIVVNNFKIGYAKNGCFSSKTKIAKHLTIYGKTFSFMKRPMLNFEWFELRKYLPVH